jgi:hypothetical protein
VIERILVMPAWDKFLVLAVVFVSMFTFAARLKKQRQQNKD